ncbi:MAG: PhnD/SsuA/transferrin family substrate-binding protein [Gemmataceae bacterium]
MSRSLFLALMTLLALGVYPVVALGENPLTIIVMDPMALELSCPCVKGYAQRDYSKLASHLEKQLNRPVKLHFADNLATALRVKTEGKADLIIGKHSVVLAGAKVNKFDVTEIAALTDKEGKTTQTGLWVVPAADPALTVADLKDHGLVFGLADADEKHAAAIALLKDFDIPIPRKLESCGSCSDAAKQILDSASAGRKSAAVISSYAQPLLEGCGTIKKGDLRVVGETEPVPFVAAFVSQKVPADQCKAIQSCLLSLARDAQWCRILETKRGFVLPETAKKK